ncbi:site-specific DNA-methyltransferase [Afifella aestuarii]|uniref:site-specific DNA-methyltransferase n=1 Tax=Afifella aestuarii TaxID=1909496 RepID=UPI000FE438F4|nr:site-specific DNA-methyltransferase [Afifella aestuarii]
MARRTTPSEKSVTSLTHDAAKRINNPTAEMASLYEQQMEILGEEREELSLARDRPLEKGEHRPRDPDRDPQIVWNGAKITLTPEQVEELAATGTVEIGDAQLVWRGKDQQDWSDLVVNAPPLYIQEKVHPKALIDDLKRRSDAARETASEAPDLFADFNGLADPEARAEFYQHPLHWQNRMILGDSLQVMASLAEREGLRGKVQAIYFDPPYGIKFNSNWQVSTLSRDVKDGKQADVSREPEQVKAFRDTWKDGIHSYLTYLRDRLSVARELLTDSGSVFVQIGSENVHRIRAVMDEVFGEENFCCLIQFQKTGSLSAGVLPNTVDFICWYARKRSVVKFRPLYEQRRAGDPSSDRYDVVDHGFFDKRASVEERASTDPALLLQHTSLLSSGAGSSDQGFGYRGASYRPAAGSHWKATLAGMRRLGRAGRVHTAGKTLRYRRYLNDFPVIPINDRWESVQIGVGLNYVVETSPKVIERCLLMTTDPGDLVLDPTCGSGTTATVAEQWGRRWITIDTSRVALALARTRLMSARYPYYLLADSPEGRAREQEVSGKIQPDGATGGDIRLGFVYERAPHITLKSIANNAEIDIIWERFQERLEPLRERLNTALGKAWEEWEIPREAEESWPKEALEAHAAWWEARIARQGEIDASIAKAADVEMLYDRPYEDRSRVRVAGPFTVESLSPHRIVTARDDTLKDELDAYEGDMQPGPRNMPEADFGAMVLDHLRSAGVHAQAKADTIHFASLTPWPGHFVAAEGRFTDEAGAEKRAAILIGPEFGTLSRSATTAAAREASDARFDILIACAFNYEAQAAGLDRLGPMPILKARMNPDLHMAEDLKNTGKGNLFVVFGEPDIDLIETDEGEIQVKVNGIDIFDPATGEIRSDDVSGIACWFIDTDYDEESFFVRHAYFLGGAKSGGSDPYKSLKTALKAEIDRDAWETLYSDTSRPFPRPKTGRIAVKVINHFGDEVLKVFGV